MNLFDTDVNLHRLLERRAPAVLARYGATLSDFGAWAGDRLDAQAEYTDRFAPPRLDGYDPSVEGLSGERVARVVFNSDYQDCHGEAYRRGAVGLPYADETSGGSHAVCFTMGYLLSHADISIHCPVTMTGAVAHVLATLAPAAVRDRYLPDLIRMDGRAQSAGTWATELHGGSDVGATTTRADVTPEGVRLTGVKWFTSNAGAGMALATARPGDVPGGRGLGCYLVPGTLPDGSPNHHRIRRLKEKAGTRGLATAELDLLGAWAVEVAAPPDGLKVMMAALEYSRIHNAVGSAGMLRRAFLEAACWAWHREAFGGPIHRYPMLRDQLLDLAMEGEATTVLAFESVLAFDARLADPGAADWLRLVTALAKYRTAEACVAGCRQAVEIVGGNGYTEEWATARLYRDSLVTALWEGPANIQALELLRLVGGQRPGDRIFLARVGAILADLPTERAQPGAGDVAAIMEGAVEECRAALTYLRDRPEEGPRHGRRLLSLLADTLAAALLLEEAVDELRLGDRRKWLVAARFTRKVLGRSDPIGTWTDPAVPAYEAVLTGGPVD
jgi:alkylation response protein AidB-like acyl-CoA dehydrogenase